MEQEHNNQGAGSEPTVSEAKHLIDLPNKFVVRPFVWQIQTSGHTPKIYFFESAVKVEDEVLEGVVVRASYRGEKIITKGQAQITTPEKFDCALFTGIHRIAAIDTNPAQRHQNKVGIGLPFYNQTVSTPLT